MTAVSSPYSGPFQNKSTATASPSSRGITTSAKDICHLAPPFLRSFVHAICFLDVCHSLLMDGQRLCCRRGRPGYVPHPSHASFLCPHLLSKNSTFTSAFFTRHSLITVGAVVCCCRSVVALKSIYCVCILCSKSCISDPKMSFLEHRC